MHSTQKWKTCTCLWLFFSVYSGINYLTPCFLTIYCSRHFLFSKEFIKFVFPQSRQILTKISGKYGKSDLHQRCFSSLFKYIYCNQNKYACITIFLVWNQDLFWYATGVNLLPCGSRNPATFKMGLFSKIVAESR